MCGIAGIVAPHAAEYSARLDRMVTEQRHRGPDDTGTQTFEHCVLGHTRLAVIDLASGHQPMLSPISPVGIVFNGEIYGYEKIRRELSDFPFRTKSDTEVILALYARYGLSFLRHLPGMFAFGLWDDSCHRLICARDRFGEKPFYYAVGNGGAFIFASELKAVLASSLVQPRIDRISVAHYLRNLYVPPYRTIYENVHVLPPAHMLVYSEGKIHVERYWDFPQPKTSVSLSEATEEVAHLLEQAVNRQMVADVPVGAFLSGGLDSSSIVATAAPLTRRIKTFSFRFGAGKNELPYAREVAETFNTDHYETSDTAPDIGSLLLRMQNIYDEPFADSSNIATFLLASFAREQVKVVLTGDGGDELFGGYAWYHTLHDFTKIPEPLRPAARVLAMGNKLAMRLAARAGLAVPPSWRRYYKILGNAGTARSVADLHWRQTAYFSDLELERLGLTILPSPQTLDQGEDPLDAALRMDLTNYMPGDILVKIDRAAMAHGLELRAPFLDVDLASYCIALPSRMKVSNSADKILLREMMRARLPGNVISREKQGFGAPVQEWLTRKQVHSLLQKHLDDPNDRLFSILPFDATRAYTARGGYHAWILLVLALWVAEHQFDLGVAS